MGRKPIERKYLKPTDGRKNNGRAKGDRYKKPKLSRSSLNKAKKERISLYAINAMKEVFGSEKEAFQDLAEKAKDGSFPHMKLFLEYAYGKPEDLVSGEAKGRGQTFNIQNIFTGTSSLEGAEESDFQIIEE